MRSTMIFAAAFAVMASTAADAANWKAVDYWPQIPRFHGCVGIVYANADFPGYYTRSKFVEKNGDTLISARHFGGNTIRAAIDAEKALHWHGCWR